jgi:hypothetical protein
MEQTIEISLSLPAVQAKALTRFLRRAGHSNYLQLANENADAWDMLYAGERLRQALTDELAAHASKVALPCL